MRFSGRVLTLAMVLVSATACNKKGGSDPKGEPAQGPSDGGPANTGTNTNVAIDTDTNTDKTITAGSVSLVTFGVVPINSTEDAKDAIDMRNVSGSYKSGNLALAVGSTALRSVGFGLGAAAPVPHPEDISSGPPDTMKIFISKVVLKKTGSNANATILNVPTGAPVVINADGTADLSGVTSAVNTAEASLRLAETGDKPSEVQLGFEGTGDFDQVDVEYLAGAEMKGCVTASWNDNPANAAHTYCTRTAHSSFTSTSTTGPAATDFEVIDSAPYDGKPDNAAEAAEATKVNLLGQWTDTMNEQTKFTITYKLPKPVQLEVDKAVPLTMLVDMNRMLRFYRHLGSSTPNPSYNLAGAYFFNTLWQQATSLTLGHPGRIYGFETVASACDAAQYDTNTGCAVQSFDIGGWLTIIVDEAGKPLFAVSQPDDDNTLTVTKGDSSYFTLDDKPFIEAGIDDAHVNLKYDLGGTESCRNGGTIQGIPAAINDLVVGDLVPGTLTFDGKKCSGGGADHNVGPIFLTRRL